MKVVPTKTEKEKELFEKWIGWISSEYIPKWKITQYRRELKLAGFVVMFLISFNINSQSSIIAAGTKDFTIGETFPIMQTITVEKKEVSLGVPKYEIPIEIPQPKLAVKKNWFIKLLKRIFNLK